MLFHIYQTCDVRLLVVNNVTTINTMIAKGTATTELLTSKGLLKTTSIRLK
ncbi:hypothetical protein [Virgibacillus halodenitrificans]|uniref:hypothetical protein n=1 Tax=Virgibacillus halodenitrificans TaxID=1482 RepID=UPI00138B1B22|nr:hypothetical protein [Virgibacillus halodenitrificans]